MNMAADKIPLIELLSLLKSLVASQPKKPYSKTCILSVKKGCCHANVKASDKMIKLAVSRKRPRWHLTARLKIKAATAINNKRQAVLTLPAPAILFKKSQTCLMNDAEIIIYNAKAIVSLDNFIT